MSFIQCGAILPTIPGHPDFRAGTQCEHPARWQLVSAPRCSMCMLRWRIKPKLNAGVELTDEEQRCRAFCAQAGLFVGWTRIPGRVYTPDKDVGPRTSEEPVTL